MNKLLLAVLLPAVILCGLNGPVIGIYTQDVDDGTTGTYIASSYIKFLEMSGAKVVPIFYNSTQAKIKSLIQQLNGVLFPGGAMSIDIKNRWTSNAQIILDYAIEQNKQNRTFPIWSTCLGHQLMSYLTSGHDSNILQRVDGEHPVVNTLQILKKDSYIFRNWNQNHFTAATTGHGIMYYSHYWAVYTKYFNSSTPLNSFWDLVAKTTSSYGQEFVAAMQAKAYPFYSVQFHPEKNPFEWKIDANRTKTGVEAVQVMSNNFVEKARQSPNAFASNSDEYSHLIYNYKSVIAGSSWSFNEIYRFNESNL